MRRDTSAHFCFMGTLENIGLDTFTGEEFALMTLTSEGR